jgi:hypothetical protein
VLRLVWVGWLCSLSLLRFWLQLGSFVIQSKLPQMECTIDMTDGLDRSKPACTPYVEHGISPLPQAAEGLPATP